MSASWWVHQEWETGGFLLVFSHVFWVIGSIVLHELAHGWAALWQGDDTPRRLRRMTLNPLVHMGPMSLLIFAVIGIAWGLMPVDPSRFRSGRRGEFLVAGAGPAMNVLLAAATLTIAALVSRLGDPTSQVVRNVDFFFTIGGVFNVILCVLNLLPLPPLDGSRMLAAVSPLCRRWFSHPNAAFAGLAALMVLYLTDLDRLIFGVPQMMALGWKSWLMAVGA